MQRHATGTLELVSKRLCMLSIVSGSLESLHVLVAMLWDGTSRATSTSTTLLLTLPVLCVSES